MWAILSPQQRVSPGLVNACVPLGLVALIVWQAVVRAPFVAALPSAVRTWTSVLQRTSDLVVQRTLLHPDWLQLSTGVATVIAGGLLGLVVAAAVSRAVS